MSEEIAEQAGEGGEDAGRRRRKRRRNKQGDGQAQAGEGGASSDKHKSRRAARNDEVDGPGVTWPGAGKLPYRPRTHRRRHAPVAGMARRRRVSRSEIDELAAWFVRLPDPLLNTLYKSLGGQPSRVGDNERIVQLAVRAIIQGGRFQSLVESLQPKDRQALAALAQCGGLAHADEFHQELVMMLGGQEQSWVRSLQLLSDKGLVFASAPVGDGFYYLVPEALIDHLLPSLQADMALNTFQHEDIRTQEQHPFCPPLDFSLATLATWMDQKPPRLTQRQEVFKAQKDELDRFFAQIWTPDDEIFNLHYDFLMMHGMIELRGDRISVNRDVVEEWLSMEAEDQRDLIFRALEKRLPLAEWVLWAVNGGKGEWIPEAPLQALYRRWRRGEEWRERFHKGQYASPRTNERETWSFTPLVAAGLLELGTWGQQNFYRLSPRAKALLTPTYEEGFSQFYLTPNYEIIAPAGLAPVMLFRLGEIAELVGCDRANTYRITEVSIEQALRKGWRREELLDFLRDNSQIGLPENVERTLRTWIGPEGDVELHEAFLLTIHRSQVLRFERIRSLRPFVLHRFAPGLYAVDPKRLPDLTKELTRVHFTPPKETRRYPASDDATDARERLHKQLAEARLEREDPVARANSADTQPEDLHGVPGSAVDKGQAKKKAKEQAKEQKNSPPPRATPQEIEALVKQALTKGGSIQMVYFSVKENAPKDFIVTPERIALNAQGVQVLVATDKASNQRLSFTVSNIWRARLADARS